MSHRAGLRAAPRGLVFTDLDGTLLDHRTYEHAPARPALDALAGAGIPLVLCSSKTRAEMLVVQREIGVAGPFIPENGGAVLLSGEAGALAEAFPDRWAGLPAKVFGTGYSALRGALRGLREELSAELRGFGDAALGEVVAWTGLDRERARLAKERDFDEPFVWEPEPGEAQVENARRWLDARGLRLTRGGRFWHLTGPSDKGRAVRWLIETAACLWGARPATLALGDSPNDLPMLAEVDEGVLVERPEGGHLVPRPPGLRTEKGVGPVGWNRAVLGWLERASKRRTD